MKSVRPIRSSIAIAHATKKLDTKLGQEGFNKLTVAILLEHVPLSFFLQLNNVYNSYIIYYYKGHFHNYDWLSLGHLSSHKE